MSPLYRPSCDHRASRRGHACRTSWIWEPLQFESHEPHVRERMARNSAAIASTVDPTGRLVDFPHSEPSDDGRQRDEPVDNRNSLECELLCLGLALGRGGDHFVHLNVAFEHLASDARVTWPSTITPIIYRRFASPLRVLVLVTRHCLHFRSPGRAPCSAHAPDRVLRRTRTRTRGRGEPLRRARSVCRSFILG